MRIWAGISNCLGFGQVVVEDPVAESRLFPEHALEGVGHSGDVALSLELLFHKVTGQVVGQLEEGNSVNIESEGTLLPVMEARHSITGAAPSACKQLLRVKINSLDGPRHLRNSR